MMSSFSEAYKWASTLPVKILALVVAGSAIIILPLTAYFVHTEVSKITDMKADIKAIRTEMPTQMNGLKSHFDSGLTMLKDSTNRQFRKTNGVLMKHILTTEKDNNKIQEAIARMFDLSYKADDQKKNSIQFLTSR